MKKIICILCFGVAALTASAQDKGKVEFGINTGINFSALSTDYGDTKSSTSFNVGASADYFFSDSWSLKVKAIYDRKGWDHDYITLSDGDHATNINLDYITVPVTAGYHFGRTNNWYLNFGVYAGFLVNAEATYESTDIKDGINSTDFGLDFGIGVKIPVSPRLKIFFEYEGQGGFVDVIKNAEVNNLNTRSALNVGINFLMN